MEARRENILINTLDNPTRVLFWDVDVFLIVVAPFFVGMAFSSLLMMLTGFFVVSPYKKFKKRYPRGTLKHKCYWNLPHDIFKKSGKFKSFPPSHERELLL